MAGPLALSFASATTDSKRQGKGENMLAERLVCPISGGMHQLSGPASEPFPPRKTRPKLRR
jgi:hypothetical protein